MPRGRTRKSKEKKKKEEDPPPTLPFINHFIFIYHKKYVYQIESSSRGQCWWRYANNIPRGYLSCLILFASGRVRVESLARSPEVMCPPFARVRVFIILEVIVPSARHN